METSAFVHFCLLGSFDRTYELMWYVLQDDSEGEDFEPGEVDEEDEEIEDGDGKIQFTTNHWQ